MQTCKYDFLIVWCTTEKTRILLRSLHIVISAVTTFLFLCPAPLRHCLFPLPICLSPTPLCLSSFSYFPNLPPFNKYNIFNISKKLNKPTCWNLMLTPVSSEHLSLKKVFEQIFMFRIVYSKLPFMFQPNLRVNKTTDWKFVFLLTVKVVIIFQQR